MPLSSIEQLHQGSMVQAPHSQDKPLRVLTTEHRIHGPKYYYFPLSASVLLRLDRISGKKKGTRQEEGGEPMMTIVTRRKNLPREARKGERGEGKGRQSPQGCVMDGCCPRKSQE